MVYNFEKREEKEKILRKIEAYKRKLEGKIYYEVTFTNPIGKKTICDIPEKSFNFEKYPIATWKKFMWQNKVKVFIK